MIKKYIMAEENNFRGNRPWNVFIPHQVVLEQSGFLTGTIYHHVNAVCVQGVMYHEQMPNSTVGFWQKEMQENNHPFINVKYPQDLWLTLRGGENDKWQNGFHCSIEIHSISGSTQKLPVVCIFFNPNDIECSLILLQSLSTVHDVTNLHLQKCEKSNVFCELKNVKKEGTTVTYSEVLPNRVEGSHNTTDSINEAEHIVAIVAKDVQNKECSTEANALKKITGVLFKPAITLPLILMWSVCSIGLLLGSGVKRVSNISHLYLPGLLYTPSIIHHLQSRARCFKAVLDLRRDNKFNAFILYNCCGSQLVDTVLGVALISFIAYYGLINQISSFIMDWADEFTGELSSLVHWLMGAPAGLKLNAQLTNFLGHFFLYHIYLWTGYLTLLKNVMPYVIWFCSCSGVLGVTVQLCLIQDALSMLTVHIYCFYVYAAKIFNLQVYALVSLWRLFRGKKWNVLRSRVDSASYNTDQLFVGTLLFTFLLFLLPTTALYYAVFTLLRLLELSVQGLISHIVAFVSSVPVFSVVLRLLAPKYIAGSAEFQICHVPEDPNCLILNMQTCQIPFRQLVKLTTPWMSSRPASCHTWGQFFTYLATGKLIYPWVKPTSEDAQHQKVE